MRSTAQIYLGRLAILGAVLGLSMFGNLRLQASEVPSARHIAHSKVEHAPDLNAAESPGNDVDDMTSGRSSAEKDDAHLVPAIYAWDPDVRFVYYRHVSKWM